MAPVLLRPFVLIADDFALTPRISRTILDLLAKKRLSGTGAMTNRPAWGEFARELKAFDGEAEIGLHLNLTAGEPLSGMPRVAPDGRLPSLGTISRAAASDAQARAEVAGEIRAQLDAFTGAFGREPDFVDGHQHVHVLPGVRAAVLAACAERSRRPWVRDPFDTPGAILVRGVAVGKALAIAGLSLGLARAARSRGLETNASFAGVSAFDPARDVRADMRRFLLAPRHPHLVMVHPGAADDSDLAGLDPVAATRPLEARHLASSAFADDLAERGVRIGRFADPPEGPLWRAA